jgi:hypothetical protein
MAPSSPGKLDWKLDCRAWRLRVARDGFHRENHSDLDQLQKGVTQSSIGRSTGGPHSPPCILTQRGEVMESPHSACSKAFLQKHGGYWVPVAHAYNPSYLGG